MSAYAEGSIAGINLEDGSGNKCKAYILDAGIFQQTVAGSVLYAADGTPFIQTLDVAAGRAFGVRLDFVPPSVLQDIVNAINTAISGGNPFTVSLSDDLTTIDADCFLDFQAGWLKVDEQRTNPTTVKGVTFRFVSAS